MSHHTVGDLTTCENWIDYIIVYINSELTSFFDNIALSALHCRKNNLGVAEFARLSNLLIRKAYAEQLYAVASTEMSRCLFIESLYHSDASLRPVFALRADDAEVGRLSDFRTAICAEFILSHELAHSVEKHAEYASYTQLAGDWLDAVADLGEPLRRVAIRECAADIFAVHQVALNYVRDVGCSSVLSALEFMVACLVRLCALRSLAEDSHHVNGGPQCDREAVGNRLHVLALREAVLCRYLREDESFRAEIEKIEPTAQLDLGATPDELEVVRRMLEVDLASAADDGIRRVSSLLARHFVNDRHFMKFIEDTKVHRMLMRPS